MASRTELDLSKLELDDLVDIQNQVLRQVAERAKVNLGNLASAHDSHSSNHSNHKLTADLQSQLDIRAAARTPR